ncbi:hypothetical protein ACQUSR_11415 [Streptomyces sp. P1-3]|uniref:hypothetical protein n=1 Tax=Streptomyces sp. P1-3 TaxID=3421658 RepID=UPI003D361216
MPRPGIRFLPVTDLTPCTALLAWQATRPLSPAFGTLLRVLRAHARTTAEEGLHSTNQRWWKVA